MLSGQVTQSYSRRLPELGRFYRQSYYVTKFHGDSAKNENARTKKTKLKAHVSDFRLKILR